RSLEDRGSGWLGFSLGGPGMGARSHPPDGADEDQEQHDVNDDALGLVFHELSEAVYLGCERRLNLAGQIGQRPGAHSPDRWAVEHEERASGAPPSAVDRAQRVIAALQLLGDLILQDPNASLLDLDTALRR